MVICTLQPSSKAPTIGFILRSASFSLMLYTEPRVSEARQFTVRCVNETCSECVSPVVVFGTAWGDIYKAVLYNPRGRRLVAGGNASNSSQSSKLVHEVVTLRACQLCGTYCATTVQDVKYTVVVFGHRHYVVVHTGGELRHWRELVKPPAVTSML